MNIDELHLQNKNASRESWILATREAVQFYVLECERCGIEIESYDELVELLNGVTRGEIHFVDLDAQKKFTAYEYQAGFSLLFRLIRSLAAIAVYPEYTIFYGIQIARQVASSLQEFGYHWTECQPIVISMYEKHLKRSHELGERQHPANALE